MRKYPLILMIGMMFFGSVCSSWAQCPEDPNDNGVCDTFYVICHDSLKFNPPPWEVHFLFLVTNDVANPLVDSICGMTISLQFPHTNPAAYCSLPSWKNRVTFTDTTNSIFRHFGGMLNRMMSLYEEGNGAEWNSIILNLAYPPHFWLSLIPYGSEDRPWWEGSRTLLATITFLVEDTMSIFVDTFFWGGFYSLRFSRRDAVTYTPRHLMPFYVKIHRSEHGDANGDGTINLGDVVYMINYLYRFGSPPVSFEAGDANCDNEHGLSDVVFLISYLYRNGPAPPC